MEAKITEWIEKISGWLSEQAWFQPIKAKWEELDPRSRTYLKAASVGGVALVAIIIVFDFTWSVHQLRNQVAEKSELLSMLQSANDEMRRLRETSNGLSAAGPQGPWPEYFESTAATNGVSKDSITVSDSKAGASTDIAKEALYEISVKHVNIKQVVRYAHNLDTGPRPVKLRDLTIDTQPDHTGYLDATLSVSAFTLAQQK